MKKIISCNHIFFQPESSKLKKMLEKFILDWDYYIYNNRFNNEDYDEFIDYEDKGVRNNRDYEEYEANLLFLAIEKENNEIVQKLLTRPDIDVNCLLGVKDVKKTVLHTAVEHENLDVIKMLLSHSKTDINAKHIINQFQGKRRKNSFDYCNSNE